jgi:hypothetical protein
MQNFRVLAKLSSFHYVERKRRKKKEEKKKATTIVSSMLAWLIFWNTLCSEKFVLVGLKPGWIPKISLLRRFPGSG